MARRIFVTLALVLLVSTAFRPAAQSARPWDEQFRGIPDATAIGGYMRGRITRRFFSTKGLRR